MNKLYTLRQIDNKIASFRAIAPLAKPPHGWIKTIRNALGLTAKQLASRLHTTRERISVIEKAEQDQAITLNTLNRVAEMLGCEFVYLFVPKKPLTEMVDQQAEKMARKIITASNLNMKLEAQEVSEQEINAQIKLLKQDLLHGNLKRLWNDET